jgi:hypothetical protein
MNIQITKIMQNALGRMSEGDFEQIATLLNDTRNSVREELKKQTSDKMGAIISKLSGSEALTPDEISLIELWVVGDAESSAALEDDFQDLITEYKRLGFTLASYENKDCAAVELFKLLGLLEDASHVSFNIANFLEKKDRIAKFKSAVAEGFDSDQRGYLKDFLNGKLNSEEY